MSGSDCETKGSQQQILKKNANGYEVNKFGMPYTALSGESWEIRSAGLIQPRHFWLFWKSAVRGLFWEDILWMTGECREKLIFLCVCVFHFMPTTVDVWKGWNGITGPRRMERWKKNGKEKGKRNGGMSGAAVFQDLLYTVGSGYNRQRQYI